ncbi:hypothetical protein CVD28_01790 [Bacillus sp. M6-12]|uniref:hypothetical protein n=1 Tax=Bacillus sp. M6-12 TaxID=2054166 RepID=UPI000C79245F|nr:hypothetical protein [Bacillus sp. M6-12]PLS19164.1 hypothetical protein CVD28_01790 [Bacillus sp. M6-12]
MEQKRVKLEEFIDDYHKLTEQEQDLQFIQKAIQEKQGVGLKAELLIHDRKIPLHELVEGSTKELFESFEDDLSLFITYLLKVNLMKLEELLYSIEFKGQEQKTKVPMEEVAETKEERESTLTSDSVKQVLSQKIEQYQTDDVINPSELYDSLPLPVQEQISLSDVHEILRDAVDENKMKLIHNATCFKCNSGYEQDYEKLPRDVKCGHCGQDIVNIEIRYKKLV